MKKLLLMAVLAVAVAAAPASAAVQNVRVSGSVDSTYVHRDNFDFGAGTQDISQDVFITQTLLDIDADLTDQVAVGIGVANERAWGELSNSVTDIDIYRAYLKIQEMLYSPLTVVVGRQHFAWNNSFYFDAAGTNDAAQADSGIETVAGDLSKTTALDAVRAILDYNPLTLEFVYAKEDAGNVNFQVGDAAEDDIDYYGAQATYMLGDNMNTSVNSGFLFRQNKSTNFTGMNADHDKLYVYSLAASTNPIEGLNLQAEVAMQRGQAVVSTSQASGTVQREALGAQFIANYQVPVAQQYNPVLQYVYTYVSGDSNPGNLPQDDPATSEEKYTAWDPVRENQGGGTVYNALYSLSNAHIHIVKLSANPMEDVTLAVSWTGLWLDKDNAGTTTAVNRPEAAGTYALGANADEDELGHELDVEARYAYTEDVEFGVLLGWFTPGDIYTALNDDSAYQALVNANVNF